MNSSCEMLRPYRWWRFILFICVDRYFHIIVILIPVVFGKLSVILPEMLMLYENTCC